MLCVFYFCLVLLFCDDYDDKLCNTIVDQRNGLRVFWLQKKIMLVLLRWTLQLYLFIMCIFMQSDSSLTIAELGLNVHIFYFRGNLLVT